MLLWLGATPGAGVVEAPLAFQSAFAGVLLAIELVAGAGGLRPAPPSTITRFDVLKPIGVYLSQPHRKHPSGRCICQDPDYAAAYRAKYG